MFRFAASSTPSTLTQTVIRLGAVAAACSALTWSLSGCGGGSRAKEYQPDSVVSFGDENSAIETYSSASNNLKDSAGANTSLKGLVYTVNSVIKDSPLYCAVPASSPAACATAYPNVGTDFSASVSTVAYVFSSSNPNTVTLIETGTATLGSSPGAPMQRSTVIGYNCAASTLWNQVVAHSFGKGFGDSCAIDNSGAKTYAMSGATITELQTQVATSRTNGDLHEGVLVTVMIGQNDILQVYDDVVSTPANASSAESTLYARGQSAAAIIQSILNTGAKVVLALTPDLGESPKAAALDSTGKDRLKAYTTAFNNGLKFGMGSTAAQDGRHFALVESDLFTNPITRSVSYVPNTAVCNLSGSFTRPDGTTVQNADADFNDRVKYCNSSTLVTNGNAYTYIWADLTHYAPAGHALIGSLAASRVANQF